MICGSLRRNSSNAALLRAVGRCYESAHPGADIDHCAIGDLPLFSEDLEASIPPPSVARIRRQVEAADAVVISTPEYNGSISGVLKNALDWLSRPHAAGVLIRKPVATTSASPSSYGAAWAQENLRFVLERCQAALINEEIFAFPNVFDALDSDGELSAPKEVAKLKSLCTAIARSGSRDWTPPAVASE